MEVTYLVTVCLRTGIYYRSPTRDSNNEDSEEIFVPRQNTPEHLELITIWSESRPRRGRPIWLWST